MSEKTPTGGNAFPRPEYGDNGMTLRDWFAGQALCGLMAAQGSVLCIHELFAEKSYKIADCMLKEREK